jgi:hypothetical protein
VERFVDPIFCFIVGTILLFIFPMFGFWLCGAGACLRVWEADIREMSINRDLDTLDGIINSKVQAQVVEQFEEPPDAAQSQPQSAVPTGLADDIQHRIQRRKAKPPPPQKGA